MRVLALTRYGSKGASSRVRMLQYLPVLRNAGIDAVVSPLLGDTYVDELYSGHSALPTVAAGYLRRVYALCRAGRFDIVWVEKECLPWLPAIIECGLVSRCSKLVADYDDAWFHRYDAHKSWVVRRLLGRKIDAVMRRASLVTVGNEYLASRARTAGAPLVVELPTVVDLARYQIPTVKQVRDKVVIGWIGSPATAHFLRMLTPALKHVAECGPIRCIAVGARADQVSETPFEAVAWNEVNEVSLIQSFDIGVMPLEDGPFERGKCGYKLIQYMACGLPVVASPVGVNRRIVTPGENGEWAGTTDEWTSALVRLAGDTEMRRRMGVAGRKRVEGWYSLEVQGPRLVKFLTAVANG